MLNKFESRMEGLRENFHKDRKYKEPSRSEEYNS